MRKHGLAGVLRSRRGVTALEFALIGNTFLVLSLGAIEYGRLMWTQAALQESVTATARCMGIQNASCASSGAVSTAAATSYLQSVASSWGVTVASSAIALNANTTCGGVAGFSQVSLSYTFVSLVPKLITALGSGLTMNFAACFPNQPP
jgi:Flp pilus assembly protein TadG